MILGTVKAPIPADSAKPTAGETSAIEAFEACIISAFMKISFRIADSTKSVLGNIEDPEAAWEVLEKRFSAKQHGLQPVLMTNLTSPSGMVVVPSILTATLWSILRTELADGGMTISDQFFYEYFTHPLPSSLDLFITLFDDPTCDVDLLCDTFAKYEMRRKLAGAKKLAMLREHRMVLFPCLSSKHHRHPRGRGREKEARYLLRMREKGPHQIKMPRWRKEGQGA